MKTILTAMALAVAALGAQAQSADAASNAGSVAGAQVGSNVQSAGTGTSASRSDSSSTSMGAAVGNATIVQQDFSAPAKTEATVTTKSDGTLKTEVSGTTTQNINYTNTSSGGTHNKTEVSGTTTVKNTPQVYSPSIGVSAPCMTALSGGVSVPGFGFGLGGSLEDHGCTARENARVLAQLGDAASAMAVMCSQESVRKAMPTKCDAALKAAGVIVEPEKKAEAPTTTGESQSVAGAARAQTFAVRSGQ
jgi:hypothetical protein